MCRLRYENECVHFLIVNEPSHNIYFFSPHGWGWLSLRIESQLCATVAAAQWFTTDVITGMFWRNVNFACPNSAPLHFNWLQKCIFFLRCIYCRKRIFLHIYIEIFCHFTVTVYAWVWQLYLVLVKVNSLTLFAIIHLIAFKSTRIITVNRVV